ncbi:MAG TPA: helix-turn-helix domain-containing protein [Candidatus Binatia bacterium]|nr:helix-turn-helix domain-containing protein [Candidatus Binatia bacterium]
MDLREAYRAKLQLARASALLLQLVDQLFLNPAITIPGMTKRLKVTARSAQLNVDKLIEAGILREVTGRQRNRLFAAPEIISIVEAQEIT